MAAPGTHLWRRQLLFASFVIVALAARAHAATEATDDRISHFLRLHLESGRPPYAGNDVKAPRLWAAVQAFYAGRDFRVAWPSTALSEIQTLVRRAVDRGLDPADYRLPGLTRDEDDRARADAQVSFALARYASDLAEGRFDPHGATYYWSLAPARIDLAGFLHDAAAAPRLVDALTRLEPDHAAYRSLIQALGRYRALATGGGWPVLTTTGMKAGARGPAALALRRRLEASGDLAVTATADRASFDAAIDGGLRRFQVRHGLEPDGVVGRDTLAALNVPVGARVRQIELSLERWRWLPRPLGRRWIAVNIPTFMLYGFDDGRAGLSMRVITGRTESPTPVFAEPMQEVVFRPYWNVPPGIAANEILPAVLRDPDYLSRNGLEVLRGGDLQFRQRPGAGNSLGLVKFLLPNPFNVYLHDTPHDQLFARARRDFSHGCMRVERPADLAQWVLSGSPEWTKAAIAAAMRAGDERHIALREPVPVYVLYMTAWAEADGTVSFAPDLYGHDAVHDVLLARARSADPAPAAAAVLASGGSPE
jgi:murein L,D-transpeptidase YcbB/YkuD